MTLLLSMPYAKLNIHHLKCSGYCKKVGWCILGSFRIPGTNSTALGSKSKELNQQLSYVNKTSIAYQNETIPCISNQLETQLVFCQAGTSVHTTHDVHFFVIISSILSCVTLFSICYRDVLNNNNTIQLVRYKSIIPTSISTVAAVNRHLPKILVSYHPSNNHDDYFQHLNVSIKTLSNVSMVNQLASSTPVVHVRKHVMVNVV